MAKLKRVVSRCAYCNSHYVVSQSTARFWRNWCSKECEELYKKVVEKLGKTS